MNSKKKQKILQIKSGDVLFVADPNVYSDKTIAALKEKVVYIITPKVSTNIREKLPFIFINKKEVNMRENAYFGIIKKETFEKVCNAKNLLSKIITQYKKERKKQSVSM